MCLSHLSTASSVFTLPAVVGLTNQKNIPVDGGGEEGRERGGWREGGRGRGRLR